MIVGCKLPHGHTIEIGDVVIALNGANVGYDPANPWRMDAFPDAADRTSGAGLTTLEGVQAEAFKKWFDLHKNGGPIKAGAIFYTDRAADTAKEAKGREKVKTGLSGIDPAADLPKGLETAKDE
jgi:hypothetical protein